MQRPVSKSMDLHLEAAAKTQRIDQILAELRDEEFNPSQEAEIALTIRFFGKNVAKLQECNEAIIKLARIFLRVKGRFVNWSLRDMNAFLLLITTMLLKRRDEVVIREVASILIEFAESMKEKELTSLAKLHSKPIIYIFHKMSKLATFYTQTKLLKILKIVASVLEDQGFKIIKQEKFLSTLGPEVAEEAFTYFKKIQSSDFVNSSRQFLKFYNEEIVQEPHMHSIKGFLLEINGEKNLKTAEIFIDFNLRNLSVGFFFNMNQWIHSGIKDEAMHFVELEDCDVEAIPFKFQDPDHIELTLQPSRCQVLDETDKPIEDISRIKTVLLVVSNKNNFLMGKIFPILKAKTAIANDIMTDQESIISFQTMATSIASVRNLINPNLTYDVIPPVNDEVRTANIDKPGDDFPKKTPEIMIENDRNEEELKSASKNPEETQTSSILITATQSQNAAGSKQESQKLTAKVVPSYNNVANPFVQSVRPFTGYDEVQHDEALPPFRQFMTHKRNIRQYNKIAGKNDSQTSFALDLNTNYSQSQTERIKKPLARRGTARNPKKNETTLYYVAEKTFDYSSVDDDYLDEVVKAKPKRRAAKRFQKVHLDCNGENETLTKRKRKNMPAKKKPVKKSPEIKAKPKSSNKKKTEVTTKFSSPSVSVEKTKVKNISYNFASVFGKKTEGSMKDAFDLMKSTESKPELPPKSNLKRQSLIEVTNEPPKKKPLIDFSNFRKTDGEASVMMKKRLKRVSFNEAVSVKENADWIENNIEPLTESNLKKHNPVTPSFLPERKLPEVKKQKEVKLTANVIEVAQPAKQVEVPTLKQLELPRLPKRKVAEVKKQKEAQLNPKITEEDKENVKPQKHVEVPTSKPAQQLESRQLAKLKVSAQIPKIIEKEKESKQGDNEVVIYNFDAVEKDGILDMFLNNAISVEQEKIGYEDSLDEYLQVRSQTVAKKLSPIPDQSILNKEVDLILSPTPVEATVVSPIAVQNKKAYLHLSNALAKAATDFFEPLQNKIKKINESHNLSAPSEAKEKLRKAVNNSRESKLLLKDHVHEHLKLLKRLQISKRRMMQLYDQEQENMTELKMSLKTVVRDTRIVCKAKMQEIEEVHNAAKHVEKEVKSSVWKKHLELVSHHFQKTLQTHSIF